MPPEPLASRPTPDADAAAVARSVGASVAARQVFADPYPHALLEGVLPRPVAAALAHLPLEAPTLDGVSGKREVHNDTRRYADAATMRRFPVMAVVAAALQSSELVRLLAATFAVTLEGTFLRLEYAQDVDGFWLEPHTDLGVKRFTCLLCLSEGPGHADLGTDIYRDREHRVGRAPFRFNAALAFVPAAATWHGFERRPIQGIRRSLILNYVSPEWRAREQLCFPEAPIRL